MHQEECRSLEQRLGGDLFRQRVFLERKILASRTMVLGHWKRKFFSKASLLKLVLQSLGLYATGFRNYLDLRIVEREVYLPVLPLSFDGFRLLQLSDLHCTLAEEFVAALVSKLAGIACDAAVLTGDYYSRFGCDHDRVLQTMEKILAVLPSPRWGVLGNYDVLELVPHLEKQKLRILLNEYDKIERGGESLFFCGVDDPAFFQTHNLMYARSGIPQGACTILLAHSPEVWKEAEALGYSFMLAGHTHGGQICFPGGRPIVCKTCIPHALMHGAWRVGALSGYTSPGTGVSWLPVRFNCPGEITVHILRRL